ncbi:MAG: glutamine--fructose-6-phosphate transaminase (isomerizing) [Clostridiales Family XIII bacterium]|jgi:glucosamine--fructose-6-phosphate aminotransferase (isomerizing)|nr:glutamine--fructose-6-phosphate transaminase (isomerizing) [Clostridiales Family XIII bacterium]
MCGIVGYVGADSAKDVIVDGLKCLEYRGYDSAGIALVSKGKILLRKESGELSKLEKKITAKDFDGQIGIGHTRWATHGSPIRENAHPHLSTDGKIAIVHNGIIENFMQLREELEREHGVTFKSETDSEVIAHLIGLSYAENGGDLVLAVREATGKMHGAYAVCVVAADNPDTIVAIRKDAPLIAGTSDTGSFIASDIPALLKWTRDIYLIENDELVVVNKDEVRIYDADNTRVKREQTHIDWDAAAAEKGGYEHFMLKEIYEQPAGIKETLEVRLGKQGDIKLDGIELSKDYLDNISKVYIVACGTASHAGLIGKSLIEKFAKIPCETDLASEFRYRDPFVDEHTLFICVSQSGETSDTLEALREAKRKGAQILSIVNVVGSSVSRESDHVFYTWAGPEIAVASTKAYTTQLMAFYLIALKMGEIRGVIDKDYQKKIIEELRQLPAKVEKVLEGEKLIEEMAKRYYKKENIFFIGRGMDVATAHEASLKLKEISYINSFSIAAGELKHGTIALIRRQTLFFVLASQDALFEKMLSGIEEIKARKAQVVCITKETNVRAEEVADETFLLPDCMDEVAPILAVVPMQILAYHIAKLRKRNIDKPRNLAKSVTVE